MNNQQPDPRLLGYKRVVCPDHMQRARQAALEAAQREELGSLLCEYADGDRIVLRFEHGRRTFLKPNVYVTVPDYCR
jgi:hypothetical protein